MNDHETIEYFVNEPETGHQGPHGVHRHCCAEGLFEGPMHGEEPQPGYSKLLLPEKNYIVFNGDGEWEDGMGDWLREFEYYDM